MSKQSNEVTAAANAHRDPSARSLKKADQHRPNRDEFLEDKAHADHLGIDDKVSRGTMNALRRFKNSPLTLMMEIANDSEQPFERRMSAAERAFPYLHRKLEDKHGLPSAPAANGGGAGGGAGPTVNLTVNRAHVTVNEREGTSAQPAKPKQTTSSKHAQTEAAKGKPTIFKKRVK